MPIAGCAADAGTFLPLLLIDTDAQGNVERLVAEPRQIIVELLDARLVTDSRPGIRGACGGLRRIFATIAVNLVDVLGLRVVRLQFVIPDRPGGRNSAV